MRAWLRIPTAIDWYLCGAITLIGALARYRLLFTQSLTIDEGSSLIFAYASTSQLIQNVIRYDAHPPLYYLSVHYAYYLFQLPPIYALRMPSFITGTFTIAVMYGLARLLMGRLAAIIAAMLTICSPIAVWYSHDGRMYAMTWFFVLLSYLLLIQAKRRPTWYWAAGYSATIALALYADISSWLAIFPQFILILMGLSRALALARYDTPEVRERARAWLLTLASYLGGWLLFSPWLAVFPQQLSLIRSVHFGVPSAQVFWVLLRNDLGLAATYASLSATTSPGMEAALLAAFVVAAITLAWYTREPRYRLYCGVTGALTVGVASVFALAVLDGSRAVLIPRVVGIGAFGFVLLATGAVTILMDAGLPLGAWARNSTGASLARSPQITKALLAMALLLTLMSGMGSALAKVGIQGYNGSQWNTIAAQITRQAGPKDIVMYYPLGIKYIIDPYLPATSPWRTTAKGLWPQAGKSLRPYFQQYLPGHEHIWFLFYSSSQITMPVYDGWIQRMGYCRQEGDPTARFGLVVYTRCARSTISPTSTISSTPSGGAPEPILSAPVAAVVQGITTRLVIPIITQIMALAFHRSQSADGRQRSGYTW